MRLRAVHVFWILANVVFVVLVLAIALLATLRIELEPDPTYDGGPVTLRESESEGQVAREYVDSHGVRHGPVSWWRDGMQVGGAEYADDRLSGLYWSDWPGGVRAMEIEHVAGDFQGPARTWHASGKIESLGTYVDGRQVGPWHFFDEQGKLDEARSGFYVDDVRLHGLHEAAFAPRPVPPTE